MAKKLKVVALVGLIHKITKQDLESYPNLVAEGIKVGDEVEVGNSNDIEELSIEHENHRKTWQAELDDLKGKLSELETTKNSCISDLEKELTEAKDKIALSVEGGNRTNIGSKSILVNHAVIVGGKKFTKEQIENDSSIQEVLLEMGSTAVTKIEG